MNPRKYKSLEIAWELLPSLFQLDGTKLIKCSGMPDDAQISLAVSDPRCLILKVHSESFPEVTPGCLAERFDVTFEIKSFS